MKLVKIALPDGEVDTHLSAAFGDYATICGLDGNDPDYQQTVPLTKSDKITCFNCKAIIAHCKQVKPSLIG